LKLFLLLIKLTFFFFHLQLKMASAVSSVPSGAATSGIGGTQSSQQQQQQQQQSGEYSSSSLQQQQQQRDPFQVEETLNRIQHHKGVVGVLVLSVDGAVIRSNMDNVQTIQYSGLITQLSNLCRSVVRDLDPENDLQILRVRTRKHEIIVSPGKR
jgi:dynein light chain roadblock-type